jgi:hypothetical protein
MIILMHNPQRHGKTSLTKQLVTQAIREGKKVAVLTMSGTMSGEDWLKDPK